MMARPDYPSRRPNSFPIKLLPTSMVRYSNGNHYVINVPAHIAETTSRNSTESPLLRLPGEIRNKIWEYASSGDVELHQHSPSNYFVKKRGAYPPAFHLPRVCRQIYSETVTLAFSMSVFSILDNHTCKRGDHNILGKWKTQSVPVHVNLITAIKPGPILVAVLITSSWLDEDQALSWSKHPLKSRFPKLQTVYISKEVVTFAVLCAEQTYPEPESWQKCIEGHLKRVGGEDIEIVFTG